MDAWPVWNYRENELVRVVCYTNASKAKLLLNGTEVGETKSYDDNTGIIFWDIPYQAGKLEVVGMDRDNNPVFGYTLQTSGRPMLYKSSRPKSKSTKGTGWPRSWCKWWMRMASR